MSVILVLYCSQFGQAKEQFKLDDEITKALQEQLGMDAKKNIRSTQSSQLGGALQHVQSRTEKTKAINSNKKTPRNSEELDKREVLKRQKKILEVKSCHDTVIGTVPDEAGKRPQYKKISNQVYRWIDAQGKVHFGAKAPEEEGQQYSSKTIKNVYSVNVYEDYFDLEINLDLNSGLHRNYYNKHLYQKIKNMYEVLIELLPGDTLLQVKIKLWVFDSLKNYRKFYKSYYPRSNPDTTLGFYSGRHYIAAARNHSGKEQVASTSVHEATHVFNHANFGVLPRWLNEGLGEYIEQMDESYPSFRIYPNKDWVTRILRKPVSLDTLLKSPARDWNGLSRLNYYAHGWALVYFLMSSDQGKLTLSKVLQEHAKFSCNADVEVDTRRVLLENYQGGINQLNTDFFRWVRGYIEPHNYKR